MGWSRRSVLATAVSLGAMLVWAPAALASVQSTLTLGGGSPPIPGALTLQTFSWGTAQSGTGGYSGHSHVKAQSVSGGEFSVTMVADKTASKLASAAISGTVFSSATLSSVHPPSSTPYLVVDFTDVQVESFATGTSGGDVTPTLRLTFAYRNAELDYAPESTCSLGARSWMGLSQVTPAADPATGGSSVDALTEFLPIQLGDGGPGMVNVADPSQADSLLKVDGANGLSNLRAQTLATRLNVGAGALDPAVVQSQLSQADALLGAHRPGSWGQLPPATQSQINQLVDQFKSTDVPAAGCPLVPQSARLTPPQTFALAGLASDACSGAPIKGLSVEAQRAGDPGPISLPVSHSAFGIPSLEPGTYALTITGAGHNGLTVPAVQIPAVQSTTGGAWSQGTDAAVALSPAGGCGHGSVNPGPQQLPALQGALYDQCTLGALSGGSASLVPPAGGSIPLPMTGNGFILGNLAQGSYGLNEAVPGHQQVLYAGGTLPAVQMPAQPAVGADHSGARFSIIVVAQPAPIGVPC